MSKTQSIQLVDKGPLYRQTKVKSIAANFRGKENVSVDDTRELFPSVFSKSAENKKGKPRDDIAGMYKEYRILEELKTSGVTPEPIIFKLTPDKNKAHLLMTKVQGISLEEMNSKSEVVKSKFDQVVESIRNSLNIIHRYGVFVVDINDGTFILSGLTGAGETVAAHVVDFELAQHFGELNDPKVAEETTRFISSRDVGTALASLDPKFRVTPQNILKIENYLAAEAIVTQYLDYDRKISPDNLSQEDQQKYREQTDRITPLIKERARRESEAAYKLGVEAGRQDLVGEHDTYLESILPGKIEYLYNNCMINITLPYLLRRKGIVSSPETVSFLQRTLTPIIDDRPEV